MYILGINAYHGDAAAAIIKDGNLIAAVEEERFNRVKHCAGFPSESVRYCLAAAGVQIEDVKHVGISRDPSAHLHKKILFAASRAAAEVKGRLGETARGRTTEVRRRLGEKVRGRSAKANADGNYASSDDVYEAPDFAASPGLPFTQSPPATTSHNSSGTGSSSHNGGPGIFRQVADRLNNAAKIHDLKDNLARTLGVPKKSLRAQFHNIEHHRAHLASSFFVSPFTRAALLSLDGFGDFISTMWALGEDNSIEVLGQVEYPHSAGIVYTATTQFLGFPHYGDEGKVMGLAPYGQARYLDEFRQIIRTEEGGQFRLDLDYFRHHAEGVDMTWDRGSPVIGQIYSDAYELVFGPPRKQGTPLTDRHRDVAASLQARLEEVGFHILNHLHQKTGLTDLGLSGGVAYNSVMNGKILINTPFRRVFIQPAAGDSGTAIGVCYQIHNDLVRQSASLRKRGASAKLDASARSQANSLRYEGGEERVTQTVSLREPEASAKLDASARSQANSLRYEGGEEQVTQTVSLREPEASAKLDASARSQANSLRYEGDEELRYVMEGAYTGPEYTNEEICTELERSKLDYEAFSDAELTERAARDIADGLVVGWFQGRMEFGPRALGNRSIVADPRRAEMKKILNDRIKKREPFRPFAPSILEEHVESYFEQTHPSPTMLMVYQIRPERRSWIPAVTHVDGSGRLQTVSHSVNPRFYDLISEFYKLTGIPVVLNTSFNENEPIVCSPRHAIECFLRTRIDVLYMGNYAVRRKC